MELNPNHPTVQKVQDQWYKLCAILVARSPGKKTTIPLDEVLRIEGMAITIKDTAGGIELQVVTMAEGERLAKMEGGLPV
jgi:hypothetical protein